MNRRYFVLLALAVATGFAMGVSWPPPFWPWVEHRPAHGRRR